MQKVGQYWQAVNEKGRENLWLLFHCSLPTSFILCWGLSFPTANRRMALLIVMFVISATITRIIFPLPHKSVNSDKKLFKIKDEVQKTGQDWTEWDRKQRQTGLKNI